ncbi:MAG: hypothetical protein NTW86_04325 [Candidatus Sumerlaeota bacterium]|nr:hypothetical protein [Candidatus Sumerlaeota bacterium]
MKRLRITLALLGVGAVAVWPAAREAAAQAAPQISTTYNGGRGGDVRSNAPVPSQSLQSTQSHLTTVEPMTGPRPGTVVVQPYGYGPGAVIADQGHAYESQFGLPDYRHGDRYYYAYPRVVYGSPYVTEKETTTIQPRTEYDTYGIGNTVKVDRVYQTTTRETTLPPVTVYEVTPRGWGHGILPSHVERYRTPGTQITQTDQSVTVLNAERVKAPAGQELVQMIDSDGQVVLVSPKELRAPERVDNPIEARAGFAWTPKPLQ